MTKEQWKKKALAWKEKFRDMRDLKKTWKGKYLIMRDLGNEWRDLYWNCEEKLKACDPDPQPDPSPDKKLIIENGKILYGGSPIKLCGVSRWEALWRETGEHGFSDGWGQYSLDWYENKLIESGINYVRHGGIKDSSLLYGHCIRMRRAGIIVEVTVFRAHKKSRGVLVKLDDMGVLAKLGNVFFDINNEFLDEPDNIAEVIRIAKILKSQGCIISGGAWSGANGLRQSVDFHNLYNSLDIDSHHRDWNQVSFKIDVQREKPVVWNEYFAMKAGLSLAMIKSLMNLAFDCGIQGVQYYGFRDEKLGLPDLTKYDPFDYQKILDYAGGLVK